MRPYARPMLRGLAALLAFLLLLQSGAAAAHCLARGAALAEGGALAAFLRGAVVCGSDGARHLGALADAVAPAQDDAHDAGCVACPLPAAAIPPAPPAPPPPAPTVEAAPWRDAVAHARPPARAPPYQPRGPPGDA